MTPEERKALIHKIILSAHKGMGKVDYLVYNDGFTALSKLTDEELLNQMAKLK